MSFDFPSNGVVLDQTGKLSPPWMKWTTLVNNIARAMQQSGTTANRPISGLWIGRQYYDVTLNQPVYVSAVNPPVWRDASGVIV
jgi:hypothetical protein